MDEILTLHLPSISIPKQPFPTHFCNFTPHRLLLSPAHSSLRSSTTFPEMPLKPQQIKTIQTTILYLDSIGLDHLSLVESQPSILSTPLSDLQSTVSFLLSLKLTPLDLRRIVSMHPQILTSDPKTITSVVTFLLREARVDDLHLCHVIHRRPCLLISDVASQLRPTLYFLRMLGVAEISKHCYLLSCSVEEKLIPRIEFFQNHGFSKKNAKGMFRKFPPLFCYSLKDNLEVKLGFLVDEMGRELKEVENFPQYFSYSFEKRIKKRHLICKESNVSFSLPALLKPSDDEFRKRLDVCVGSSPPLKSSPLWGEGGKPVGAVKNLLVHLARSASTK